MPANLLPLEHLTDADFAFLAAAVSPRSDARDRIARLLRDGGEAIQRALEDRRTHQALRQGDAARDLSPYLLFSVLLYRRRAEERSRVQGSARSAGTEGTNPSRGDPRGHAAQAAAPSGAEPARPDAHWLAGRERGGDEAGDAPAARGQREGLLDSPWTVHYLAELLACFAYTPPGMAAFTLGGRHFRIPLAEVDLASLNKVALLAAEPERLSIYRRLGDLTLFLSSVAVEPVEAAPAPEEGARSAAASATGSCEPRKAEGAEGDRRDARPGGAGQSLPYREEELEREGRRFYEHAAQHRGAGTTYLGRTLVLLAAQYGTVRTLLRQILHQDLPAVYPGGLAELASRWGNAPQPGVEVLSAPEGRRE